MNQNLEFTLLKNIAEKILYAMGSKRALTGGAAGIVTLGTQTKNPKHFKGSISSISTSRLNIKVNKIPLS